MTKNFIGFGLVSLFLLLAGCGQNTQNPPQNQNPQDESEIQKITYSPDQEDFLVIPDDSNSNIYNLSLPVNQSGIVNLTIKAQNISGSVKSIAGYSQLVISQNCVKTYELNESCIIPITIGETVKGVQIIRVATTAGNKFVRIFIQRIGVVQTENPDIRLEGSISFGTVVGKNVVTKLVTIKNYGADTTVNKTELTGAGDNYKITYNSCLNKIIKKGSICSVRVSLDGRNKPSGQVSSSLVIGAVGQADTTSAVSANVLVVDPSNLPPQITLDSFYAISGSPTTININATDPENDSLTYWVDNPVYNASIDNLGNLTLTLLSGYSTGVTTPVVVGVSDGKHPVVYKNILVNYLSDMIYTGNTTFPEGEVKTPLFSMTFNVGQKINNITTNLNTILTTTKITGTGVLGLTNPLVKGEVLPVNPNNNGSMLFQIEGGIKYAGSYQLQINATLSNNQIVTFRKNITVTPSGLPYLKYDIWAVKNSSGTYNGYIGDEIGVSAKELFRQYGIWRTPILVRLTNEPIICNGSEMTNYDADQSSMKNCIANKASVDAESAFYFDAVYAGTDRIGGIANGTRKSLVVEKSPWDYTLAHELGHQFGLWHTFETYWNDYLFHCSGAGIDSCFYYYLIENTGGRNKYTIGDWANTRVDYFDSSGTVPFIYVASDDTGKDYYGGKVTSLNLNSTASMFGFSNSPYVNGNQVVLSYGGQSYSTSSGFACIQNLSGNSILQNGNNIRYYVNCTNIPGLGNFTMSNEIVKNTMSYWYHESNSARFSTNQKSRMDQVINQFSELSQP